MRISTIITLSRPESVPTVKESLKLVNEDLKENTLHDGHELILMIDNHRIGRSAINEIGDYDFKIVRTRNGEPPRGNAQRRRDRITQVRNLSREAVSKESDLVFSFEDDTILPKNALSTLLKDYEKLDNVGIISGIQVGRWGRPYLGAWHTDNLQFPEEIMSLNPREAGAISSVDGTGFYCFLTPTKLYRQARFGWFEPLGPDAFYGFWLKAQRYNNYVDRRVVCGHQAPSGALYPDASTVQLKVSKKGINRWKIETVQL